MIKYLLKRLAGWVLMIVLATNLTYFLCWGFLDPRENYLQRKPVPSDEQIARTLGQYNLDAHVGLAERWWHWASGILTRWDWGSSPVGVPVTSEIAPRIAVSAQLLLFATVASFVIGIVLAIWSASRQYSLTDKALMGTSVITMNVNIVVASVAVVFLGIHLNQALGFPLLYVTGATTRVTDLASFLSLLQHLALPTVALIVISYAGTHVLQRSLLLDTIDADYVRMARAKGLSRGTAIRRHALRTALIPVATSFAYSLPGIFTGAILTESIFAWRGMGEYFALALGSNDIHAMVAISAFGAVTTAVGALLADVLVVALDPRVRVS